MAKDMTNQEIREYEGGDFAKVEDNYNLHQLQVALANRAGKAAEAFEQVEQELEEIKNNPDVVDIVATKAALDSYDTSKLTDKDIIRVLADETHDGASTYYRYNKSSDTFTYIGEVGDYYTKSQTDILLATKEAKTLTGAGAPTTSTVATNVGQQYYDTTNNKLYYCSAIATDPDSYTWEEMGGGSSVTVVQTTGTSTTDVMSQDASTKMVYAAADSQGRRGICIPALDGHDNRKAVAIDSIMIGSRMNNAALGNGNVSIGQSAGPTSSSTGYTVCVGTQARAEAHSVAIGECARTSNTYSTAVGENAATTRSYEFSIAQGYGAHPTRYLANVTDPTNAQDAATKHYVDNAVIAYTPSEFNTLWENA